MAWLPMQRSSIFQAAARARSRAGVSSTMFTYYCIGAMGLLLLLAVCSELFIGLAPDAYAEAAPFVAPPWRRPSPPMRRSTRSTGSGGSGSGVRSTSR